MRTLAHELAPDMVRVNTVHPGSVNTPMIQNQALYHAFLPDRQGDMTPDDLAPVYQATNALPRRAPCPAMARGPKRRSTASNAGPKAANRDDR